jgi:colanic acid/amylovoran biosynthesis glycosyltransferase
VVAPAVASVLAVVNDFPAPSQTFILRKLQGLSAVGYHITVAAERFSTEARSEGFDLVPLAPWKGGASTFAALGPRRAIVAGRALVGSMAGRDSTLGARRRLLLAPIVSSGPDIVHFEFSGIGVELSDLLDEVRPSRLVVSCRGAAEQIVPLRDPRRGPALAELFARVDLIHCVSEDIAETAESFGAPRDRILVNRPAVPVGDLAPLAGRREPHDGPLRVLSIGRLHWKKGFDDALRAVAMATELGCAIDYRIAGEGPEHEKLSFLAHQLDLGDGARLLGVQRQDEIRDQLAWADVLLLPSLSEGISNAVLEAMASGLPVIATRCGGMDEVIDPGGDGFLVDIGDLDAMQHHLTQIADDRDLAARLGRAAGARARAEFDLSRQVQVFVDAYRGLASAGSGPGAG